MFPDASWLTLSAGFKAAASAVTDDWRGKSAVFFCDVGGNAKTQAEAGGGAA